MRGGGHTESQNTNVYRFLFEVLQYVGSTYRRFWKSKDRKCTEQYIHDTVIHPIYVPIRYATIREVHLLRIRKEFE